MGGIGPLTMEAFACMVTGTLFCKRWDRESRRMENRVGNESRKVPWPQRKDVNSL